MTYYWAVRLRETGEEQFVESEGPYAPYDGDFFEIAELPRAINPLAERWDWEAGEIVSLVTPQIARDVRWKAAQDYRELRRNAPLPVWGVFPNRAVVVAAGSSSPHPFVTNQDVGTLAQVAKHVHTVRDRD